MQKEKIRIVEIKEEKNMENKPFSMIGINIEVKWSRGYGMEGK